MMRQMVPIGRGPVLRGLRAAILPSAALWVAILFAAAVLS